MASRTHISLEGRDVHIVTGQISQTVNVCDANNRIGDYDWVVRLFPPQFVSAADAGQHASIDALVDWLINTRSGKDEKSPPSQTALLVPSAIPPSQRLLSSDDVGWVQRAMQITEMCIDEMLQEFLEMPYLHRVEHSAHVRLHTILSVQPHFSRHFPLAGGQATTQPIHKEWPETIPRPEKGNRRGNFDLAILPPDLLNKSTLEEFSQGRIAAPIVIEIGLNYGNGHLASDADKLLNSKVEHGYLVHLVRELPHETSIEATIIKLLQHKSIKVGFARVERDNKFIKLLNDSAISQVV